MRGFAGGAWHMSAAPRLLPDELPVSGAVAGQQCRRQAVKSIKLNDGGMKLRLITRGWLYLRMLRMYGKPGGMLPGLPMPAWNDGTGAERERALLGSLDGAGHAVARFLIVCVQARRCRAALLGVLTAGAVKGQAQTLRQCQRCRPCCSNLAIPVLACVKGSASSPHPGHGHALGWEPTLRLVR